MEKKGEAKKKLKENDSKLHLVYYLFFTLFLCFFHQVGDSLLQPDNFLWFLSFSNNGLLSKIEKKINYYYKAHFLIRVHIYLLSVREVHSLSVSIALQVFSLASEIFSCATSIEILKYQFPKEHNKKWWLRKIYQYYPFSFLTWIIIFLKKDDRYNDNDNNDNQNSDNDSKDNPAFPIHTSTVSRLSV